MGFLGYGGAGGNAKGEGTGESDSFKGFSFMKEEEAAAAPEAAQRTTFSAPGAAGGAAAEPQAAETHGGSSAVAPPAAVETIHSQSPVVSNLTNAIRASNSGEP